MHAAQQTTLYHIKLPQFIINFKSHIVDYVVPHLLQLKQIINEQQNTRYVNPLVVLIVLGAVVVVLRNLWIGLFGGREQVRDGKEEREVGGEINDLKKQLKALKVSFGELAREINNNSKQTNLSPQISQQNSQPQQSLQLLHTLLPLYTTSLHQNKQIVNYVLQSQFQVLKQLKKFKKVYKNSISSSGRPSTSTIRSKTSQKKVERVGSKSPVKMVGLTTASQVKKVQNNNVKQNHNKVAKNSIDELLKPQAKTLQKPQTKTLLQNTQTKSLLKSQKIAKQTPAINRPQQLSIPQRESFEKLQQKVKTQQELTQNTQKSEQLLIPVTSTLQTPTITHNKNKVQSVQTIIKQTQFTQIIETQQSNGHVKVHQEMLQQTTTRVQTVQGEQFLQGEQMTGQGDVVGEIGQLQEPEVYIAPRPPQIKKMMPPMTKPTGRRPPPPPQRK